MRNSSLVLLLGLLVGCGHEPRTIHESGLVLAPPETIGELASGVRAGGGVVFVVDVQGPPFSFGSALSDEVEPGVFLSFPRAVVGATVIDSLGSTVTGSIEVITPAGPPTLAHADGSDVSELVLETDDPTGWERAAAPSSGTWVFFAYRREDGRFDLAARAAVDADGNVDGSITRGGMSVPVDTLRT